MQRNHLFAFAIAGLGAAVLIRGCGDGGPAHDGKIRQTAQLRSVGLRRGAEGSVFLTATGHYTVHDADAVETYPVTSFASASLTLVDGAGAAQPLKVKWSWQGNAKRGVLTLPDVPDGDYKLHAVYATELGKGELDLPLPLYSPARV